LTLHCHLQVPFFQGAATRCVSDVMLAMVPRLYSPQVTVM
jgi:hypothetical protein